MLSSLDYMAKHRVNVPSVAQAQQNDSGNDYGGFC